MLLIVYLLVALIAIFYWYLKKSNQYWLEKGVEQGNPVLLFGHNWDTVSKKQSFAEVAKMIYNLSSTARYVGFYQFLSPILALRDPDLIRQITVKDFDHFVDHQSFVSDPLIDKNLFSLRGKKWRDMRATLSPSFTSSKMKFMFGIMTKSAQQFVDYFRKQNEEIVTIEMKDTYTRFTNDVIANSAFGVECDSLTDRKNEFYLMGKEATDVSGFGIRMKLFFCMMAPSIAKLLGIRIFDVKIANFFNNLVKTNIESREKHGIVRPDMIHLLLQARKNGVQYEESTEKDAGFATVQESEIGKPLKNTKVEISDEDIASQALIFFFAGFDTVSSSMCFMSYELAVNPEIQKRLIDEIDKAWQDCNGTLSYEIVMNLKYLDMVISETLRKWPVAVATDRLCTKSYTIEPQEPNERPIHIKPGNVIWVPIFGIHYDPQYYPEPERFDPERFNEENKSKINPYTYLPFGAGPRNCIGSRFTLMEIKILFIYILRHFEIVPVKQTQIPLVICKNQVNLTAENGFWLGLKRRTEIE